MSTVKEVLERDSIAESEEILGKHHSEWDLKPDTLFALAKGISDNQHKKSVLEQAGDTNYGDTLESYMQKAKEVGFEIVLNFPFKSIPYDDNDPVRNEAFYVLWEAKRGILLVFDTYYGNRVNGGNFYYNIKPKDINNFFGSRVTSSGGFRDGIWVGHHDCREGLKFHIQQLEKYGDFVNPWIEQPFLWLLHYSDTESGYGTYDHREINQQRINLLPTAVQEAIKGK
jgi:hypothetical protein